MGDFKKSRAEVIAEIIKEADAKVDEPLTRIEAVAYLRRLIDIHQLYIDITYDDVSTTGTDAWHQYWIDKYTKMISLIGQIKK
jgi:hypothetical protein